MIHVLRASSADRWVSCPASATLVRPDDRPDQAGVAAARGTMIHAVLAIILSRWTGEVRLKDAIKSASDLVGASASTLAGLDKQQRADVHGLVVNKPAVAIAAGAAEYVNAKFPGARRDDVAVYSEVNVYDGWGLLVDGVGGTFDVALIKDGAIEIVDLKTGKIPVDPDCWQLKVYLAGAWLRFGDKTTREGWLTVHQGGEPHTVGPFTGAQVREWIETVLDAREKIVHNSETSVPGEHCAWCPVAGRCRANRRIFGDPFSEVPPPPQDEGK